MATLHPDGFWYADDEYLGRSERNQNALYIATVLYHRHGWTLNAIAGILGNMETESTMNPGLWENRTNYENLGENPDDNSHGYGLVQWTPWGKYTNYAERHGLERVHIVSQLQRIQAEVDNNLQWITTDKFPLSFKEFTQSKQTPYYLAGAFVRNYERPNITDETYVQRGNQANFYYSLIQDVPKYESPNLNNAAKIASAIEWAVGIANDDTHGYDQTNRWGDDYDCSSLLIQAYENAGVPVKTNGANSTADMRGVFVKCGFVQWTWVSDLELVPGDVLWREGHCAMFIGEGQIVSAHINELGTTTGGTTGDQTGHEIDVSDYASSGVWSYVMRLPTFVDPQSGTFGKNRFKLLMYAVGADII